MNKTRTEILEYVRAFADKAHGDQVRKYTGERYIVHPVRVMEMVRKYNEDISVGAAALLHDVLEDTPVMEKEMSEVLRLVMEPGEARMTLQLVVELTDVFVKKDYPGLKRAIRKQKEVQRLAVVSPEAQTIKYADIIDNVTDIVRYDSDFAKVFVREAKSMLVGMTAGNQQLRGRALALVDSCLQEMQREPRQARATSPRS